MKMTENQKEFLDALSGAILLGLTSFMVILIISLLSV